MSSVIPFPQSMGKIFGTAARNNGNILAAATKVEISWHGNRAIAVGAEVPSFQTAQGNIKDSNEKDTTAVNMVTFTLPCDFRMTVQQVEQAKKDGTYDELVAERLADCLAKSTKAVEYAIIHGYDLATGSKLNTLDTAHGCIDWAVGSRALTYQSPLKNYGAALTDLDDFEATNIFTTPKHYQDTYTDEEGKGQIPFNTKFDYIGIPTAKSDVVGNRKKSGVQNNAVVAGDFTKLIWGVLPLGEGLQVVTDGNPRGKGELRDTNEVAFIFEAGYAWAITVPEAFAIVKAEPAAG